MLLRNYDNIIALNNTCFVSGKNKYFNVSTTFGDGEISLKRIDGTMYTSEYWGGYYNPFYNFYNGGNGNYTYYAETASFLICGYEENEVTYDDYKIDNLASGLKFVENSVSRAQLNENNEVVSTYTKILCNTGSTDITINCIGVAQSFGSNTYGICLVYKEKIPEITIAPKQNVVLTFTTKVPMGQNKPADYSVNASA